MFCANNILITQTMFPHISFLLQISKINHLRHSRSPPRRAIAVAQPQRRHPSRVIVAPATAPPLRRRPSRSAVVVPTA